MINRTQITAILDEAAGVLFDTPTTWVGWITYLLEALQDDTDAECYEEFLRNLKGAITARLEDRRW